MTFEDIVIAIFWCFIFALITLGLLFFNKVYYYSSTRNKEKLLHKYSKN